MISEYTLESWAKTLDQAYHQEKDLWFTLQVLADWLEERDSVGDSTRSVCLRWCAEKEKRPREDTSACLGKPHKSYDWWVHGGAGANASSDIPVEVIKILDKFLLIKGERKTNWNHLDYREYPTPSAAYFALCEAWVLLGKDAPT